MSQRDGKLTSLIITDLCESDDDSICYLVTTTKMMTIK